MKNAKPKTKSNSKTEFTLGIIKPDATKQNTIGEILAMVEKAEFTISKITLTKLSQKDAKEFYAVHKERPFFTQLIKYITSGPIVAFKATKKNAVEDYRKLIGSTNPAEASRGTIRKKYGKDKEKNAVHGSDSKANAIKEVRFFFGK